MAILNAVSAILFHFNHPVTHMHSAQYIIIIIFLTLTLCRPTDVCMLLC